MMLLEAMNGLEIGTLAEMDRILTRIWETGAQGLTIKMGTDAVVHFKHLGEEVGTVLRMPSLDSGAAIMGVRLSAYVHPISGEPISIEALPWDRERIEFHAETVPEPPGYGIDIRTSGETSINGGDAVIGARFEPPSLWLLQARQRDLGQERLKRCLTMAEEMELARTRGQIERLQAPVTEALECLARAEGILRDDGSVVPEVAEALARLARAEVTR
jgi:hypothetical protein